MVCRGGSCRGTVSGCLSHTRVFHRGREHATLLAFARARRSLKTVTELTVISETTVCGRLGSVTRDNWAKALVSHYHTPSREHMAHTHNLLWSSFFKCAAGTLSLHLPMHLPMHLLLSSGRSSAPSWVVLGKRQSSGVGRDVNLYVEGAHERTR